MKTRHTCQNEACQYHWIHEEVEDICPECDFPVEHERKALEHMVSINIYGKQKS
jgi:hypothetical protein